MSRFEAAVDAVVGGDREMLAKMLRQEPELVGSRSARGHEATLLHYCAANGVEDERQRTPANVVEIVEMLLGAGADVNATAKIYGEGATTLGLAATSVHPEKAGVQEALLQALLDGGAELQQGDVAACLWNGRFRSAEFLASELLAAKLPAAKGVALGLPEAAGLGRLEDVHRFFAEGVSEQQMPDGFLLACEYGQDRVIEYLVARGVDVRAATRDGQTGLHMAAIGGQAETVKLLLRLGLSAEATNGYGGTALGQARWCARESGDAGKFGAVIVVLEGIAAGDLERDCQDVEGPRSPKGGCGRKCGKHVAASVVGPRSLSNSTCEENFMVTTQLGSMTVRTFPVPPADFNLTKATNSELATYGFPPLPAEHPELVARWAGKLDASFRMIQPTFTARPPRRTSLPSFLGKHGTQYDGNWAGVYVEPPAGTKFKWVESTWRFPQSYLPGGDEKNIEYFASTWIGIDGDNGSGDILQAGCDSDVSTSGGSALHQYNPWWEWFPAGSFWINNLTFAPGDEISMLICVTEGSTSSAAVFFSNNTKKTGMIFHAIAPAGTHIVGDSAEWIVEALSSSIGFTLAKFDTVQFKDCQAGTVAGGTVQSGSGQLIDMTGAKGVVIATTSLIGSTEVQVKYTGP